jgi:hypothetical protein
MKRGFKALAVLAAVAAAVAGPDAFAVCTEFGGFAAFQCAERAWFDGVPSGGTVSAVFWQVGYGNNTLNSGLGSAGTGNSGLTTFNGNDGGLWSVNLVLASSFFSHASLPPDAICLGNNNWANLGVDGCCDDFRDTGLPGGTGDDGVLNPLYNVYYQRNGVPGIASDDWVVDYPMAVLLRESTGHWFALAAVASTPRTGVGDVRVGDYNFKDVGNGNSNPITGAMNIIPWQRIPGDRVPGDPSTNLVRNSAFADPNNLLSSNRILDLGWNLAAVHSDVSTRPSTNSTMVAPGAGVADMGPLVRYVVETQGIVDPNNPYTSLNPAGWTAVATIVSDPNTQITVAPDTCVRLHTYFGKEPQTATQTTANCRLGRCGDIGYDVVSAPACIGGPLVADGRIDNLIARRERGSVSVTWSTQHELNVRGFTVYAVTKKGAEVIGKVPCTACGNGLGATYEFKVQAAKLKGARTVEIVVDGTDMKFKAAVR